MRVFAVAVVMLLGCGKKSDAPAVEPAKVVAVDARAIDARAIDAGVDALTVRPPQTFYDAERLPAHGVFGEVMGLGSTGPLIIWVAVDFDANQVAFQNEKGKQRKRPLTVAEAAQLKTLIESSRSSFGGPASLGCTDYREILAVGEGPLVLSIDTHCPLDHSALGPLRNALWALKPR
jgi:hypothetical protein